MKEWIQFHEDSVISCLQNVKVYPSPPAPKNKTNKQKTNNNFCSKE